MRMRQIIKSIVTAGPVILLLMVSGAHSGEKPAVPMVEVSATGTTQLAPDMAVLSLSVLREAKTARAALDANNIAMGQILVALRNNGIAKKDLQTTNFNIQPRYQPRKSSSGNRQAPQIISYQVRNSLTVRVRDLENLGSILDLVVTLGVNSGGNIRFTNSDPSEAISLARSRAMKNAMQKAETLVVAAGGKLGKIILITENSNNARPVPIAMARASFKGAAEGAVPVAQGENAYSVSVQAKWEIE